MYRNLQPAKFKDKVKLENQEGHKDAVARWSPGRQ